MQQRLFNYISGSNEGKKKVDMTSPVTVQTTPGQGPACSSDFMVSFFLPFQYQVTNPRLVADSASCYSVHVRLSTSTWIAVLALRALQAAHAVAGKPAQAIRFECLFHRRACRHCVRRTTWWHDWQ